MKHLKGRLQRIKDVHDQIRAIAARPASNMKLMQVAGPFREVINHLKSAEEVVNEMLTELEVEQLLK